MSKLANVARGSLGLGVVLGLAGCATAPSISTANYSASHPTLASAMRNPKELHRVKHCTFISGSSCQEEFLYSTVGPAPLVAASFDATKVATGIDRDAKIAMSSAIIGLGSPLIGAWGLLQAGQGYGPTQRGYNNFQWGFYLDAVRFVPTRQDAESMIPVAAHFAALVPTRFGGSLVGSTGYSYHGVDWEPYQKMWTPNHGFLGVSYHHTASNRGALLWPKKIWVTDLSPILSHRYAVTVEWQWKNGVEQKGRVATAKEISRFYPDWVFATVNKKEIDFSCHAGVCQELRK